MEPREQHPFPHGSVQFTVVNVSRWECAALCNNLQLMRRKLTGLDILHAEIQESSKKNCGGSPFYIFWSVTSEKEKKSLENI